MYLQATCCYKRLCNGGPHYMRPYGPPSGDRSLLPTPWPTPAHTQVCLAGGPASRYSTVYVVLVRGTPQRQGSLKDEGGVPCDMLGLSAYAIFPIVFFSFPALFLLVLTFLTIYRLAPLGRPPVHPRDGSPKAKPRSVKSCYLLSSALQRGSG